MKSVLAVVLFCIAFPLSVLAETKEIVAEGTYNMGDGETPTVAESRALLQAKRTAVEEAGTYVESYSKTRNFQLTVDEIQVLASGIMEVEVIEKKRTVVGDGFNFWIKIKARVSTDKMQEMAKRVKDKSVVEDYKIIQAAYDNSQKEIEELKRKLAEAKSEGEKKQVEARIADEEKLFQANQWFEKGIQSIAKKDDESAIDAFTKAITLNPNMSKAYAFRGLAYRNKSILGNKNFNDLAIGDYTKSIDLEPNNASIYVSRGFAYYGNKEYEKALNDYNKAISLNPNDAFAFFMLGTLQNNSGQFEKALENFNKAIMLNADTVIFYTSRSDLYFTQGLYNKALDDISKAILLNPADAFNYEKRGNIYLKKGEYDKAIADYTKAINMVPKRSYFYLSRGEAYGSKQQFDKAIEDYSKAIQYFNQIPRTLELIKYLSKAYNGRGKCYLSQGESEKAIQDFQMACEMESEDACNNLKKAAGNR